MSQRVIDEPERAFATSEELDALRREVDLLRDEIRTLRTADRGGGALASMKALQAGYDALPPEAKELHAEAEAEARASLRRARARR